MGRVLKNGSKITCGDDILFFYCGGSIIKLCVY